MKRSHTTPCNRRILSVTLATPLDSSISMAMDSTPRLDTRLYSLVSADSCCRLHSRRAPPSTGLSARDRHKYLLPCGSAASCRPVRRFRGALCYYRSKQKHHSPEAPYPPLSRIATLSSITSPDLRPYYYRAINGRFSLRTKANMR